MSFSNHCISCGGARVPGMLRGLCPLCLVRWTRPPQLPGKLDGSIWLWDSAAGVRIEGYELGDEIGRGGFGIVYRARQVSLDRPVAMKLLLEGPFADPSQIERFRLEAKAAASLDHPSIVSIYEIGQSGGRMFYSMRLVEGPTLEKIMDRFCLPAIRSESESSPRNFERALRSRQLDIARFLAEVARAVHHAHQHGVLHRDLKPGNILIAEGNRPMITDFGLVWLSGENHAAKGSGEIHGTPNYIAPELTRDPGRSSVASDIYSVAAIGYECLTGEPPFEAGNGVETLIRIRNGHLSPPRDLEPAIDRDLEAIVLRCLDPNPARRYSTAAALAEDLDRFVQGAPVEARDPRWLRLGWYWVQKHPCRVGLAIATVLALVAVATLAWATALRRDTQSRLLDLSNQSLRIELQDSMLARLESERLSGFHGNRSNILAELRRLYKVRPNTRILDEAIAQLARSELPTPQQLHARIHPRAPVALTPDFRVRLEADTQGRIIATDHETGARIWDWGDGNAAPFRALHPSPDGRHLLAVRKGRATLLRFPSPNAIAELPFVDLVGFSPEGDWFLTVDPERRLNRHETRTGQLLGVLPDGSVNAGNIAICPDPQKPLIAISAPGQIRIIDWTRGTLVSSRTNGLPNGIIRWVDDWLVHLVDGNRVVSYNLQSGREYILGQFSSPVMTLDPIPHHCQIAATTESGEVRLFDLNQQTRLLQFHDMRPLQFSADGRQVMIAVQDSWGTAPYQSPGVFVSLFPGDPGQDPIRSVEFSPAGDVLLVTKQAGVHLIPLGGNREPGFLPAMGAVQAGWIPGTDEVVVQTRGSVRWHGLDPETLQPSPSPIHQWNSPGPGWMERGALCLGTPSLMVARPDSRIEEIHLGRRETLRIIQDARFKEVRHLDHSGDEILFDSKKSHALQSLGGLLDRVGLRQDERIEGFRFSPDGKALLLSSGALHRHVSVDGWTNQWSYTTSKVISSGTPVIAWSPDSRHIALVTGPNKVGLFSAKDGIRIAQLTHSFEIRVTAMAISPGGRWIAIGLQNGSVHLWNLHRLQKELHDLGSEIDGPTEPEPAIISLGARTGGRRLAQTEIRLQISEYGPVTVPERDSRCTGSQLDLGPRRDGVSPSRVVDSAEDTRVPSGFITDAGTAFDARWALQLDSRVAHLNREVAPASFTNRLDHPALHRIHLLGNVNFAPTSVKRPLEIALLRLRYQNGTSMEFPIRLGIEVEDVWSQDDEGAEGKPRVAWRGMDPFAEVSGRRIQLYHATFVNPHPEQPVESLEIHSTMALPSLLISGITVE